MPIIRSRFKHRIVVPSVRICVDCGSTRTDINYKSITCRDCGTVRYFGDTPHKPGFEKGDLVRIIDSEKNSDIIYKIKKTKKSHDGTKMYLLKSKSRGGLVLYHESTDSYLEKVDYYVRKDKEKYAKKEPE